MELKLVEERITADQRQNLRYLFTGANAGPYEESTRLSQAVLKQNLRCSVRKAELYIVHQALLTSK